MFAQGVRCATVIPFAPYGSAIIAWTQKTLHPPAQRFALWCGQAQRSITPEQRELFKKIAVYIAQNGSCDIRDLIQTMPEVAGSLISFCRSADAANKELFTLNEFILKAA